MNAEEGQRLQRALRHLRKVSKFRKRRRRSNQENFGGTLVYARVTPEDYVDQFACPAAMSEADKEKRFFRSFAPSKMITQVDQLMALQARDQILFAIPVSFGWVIMHGGAPTKSLFNHSVIISQRISQHVRPAGI